MSYLLEARNLSKSYDPGGVTRRRRRVMALDDFSYALSENPNVIGLVGESGSGKSTLGKLLLGLLTPTSGDVLYKQKSLRKLSKTEHMKYRREVQGIFQDPYAAVNPLRRLRYVFEIMAKNIENKNDREVATRKVLTDVGLDESFLDKYPHEMSGGQLQRIMIARAFLCSPKIIVADEPVSMLDASLRANILNLMLDMKDKYRTSFFYITHDISTSYSVADELIVLYGGVVVESGDTKSVINDPLHPYTKELLLSVPKPDPSKRWKSRIDVSKIEVDVRGTECCKFFHRCTGVTERCKGRRPSLVEVKEGHRVSCFQYSENDN